MIVKKTKSITPLSGSINGSDHFFEWEEEGRIVSRDIYDELRRTRKSNTSCHDKIETYFTLLEEYIAHKAHVLLAVEELRTIKEGSMEFQEFYSKSAQTH